MSQFRITLTRIAAVALWLTTIALGVVDVYFVRQIFFGLYARFSRQHQPAILFGDVLVVLAAIGVVVFIVVSTEFHRKHFCKHESWDLFAWTLVVQLAIPFIAVFIV